MQSTSSAEKLTSNYTFLTKMTRNGSLIPKVWLSIGQEMKLLLMLAPIISIA